MPALSRAQQKLMAQAYAIKVGKMDPSEINHKYKDVVMDLVDGMTEEQLKKYSSTSHKGLPETVKENLDEGEDNSKIGIVKSKDIPKFYPKGPGKIEPYLDLDSKQKTRGKRNLENLKDYRDWVDSK